MPAMNHPSDPPHTSDICLLLRAHGEQHWLIYEVVPVVRSFEQGAISEDESGAALAYLEALSIEAHRRAAETDVAYAELEAPALGGDVVLYDKARRYHAAVRRLRDALARRIDGLLAPEIEQGPRRRILDRYASS
jgi:hypothetical protein